MSVEQDAYEYGADPYVEPPNNPPPPEIDDRDESLRSADDDASTTIGEGDAEHDSETLWLQRARTTYANSTDYITNSLRHTWERNWRLFRNQHPNDSKYFSDTYRGRSRTFRPKLRSASTQRIAALSAALHSNDDILDVSARDSTSNEAKANADVMKILMQYRLENDLDWFMLSLGAFQSCDIYNVCISRQEWRYEVLDTSTYEQARDEQGEPLYDDDGTPLGYREESSELLEDRPVSQLVRPENFRFDPNADWINPLKDSPYLIENMPMFAGDVLTRMETINPLTGAPPWRKLTLSQIVAAGREDQTDAETVRLAREGDERRDPADVQSDREDTLVWVRRYIIREGYKDWTFYTLGGTYLLTEPTPLDKVSKIGRNYVIGMNSLEVFRNYPGSAMELGADLQEDINDLANQRSDNVKLVLNKRYFIKRQRQGSLDLQALTRNTPGGGILIDDPSNDVKVVDTPDITGSSYRENDQMAVELDELLGNFSQASVQSNRQLNETVGGMNMISESANGVQELAFKVFVSTWAEPVLKQLVQLEAAYETDEVLLALAGNKSEIFKRYGIDRITDNLLDQALLVKVNVGMGHTNPVQKMQKLSAGVETMLKVPEGVQRLNFDEINKEIWGYLGFADGQRFTLTEDQIKQPDPMADPEIQIKMQDLQRKAAADQALQEYRAADMASKERIRMAEIESKERTDMARLEESRRKDESKDDTVRTMAAVREANKSRELTIKAGEKSA